MPDPAKENERQREIAPSESESLKSKIKPFVKIAKLLILALVVVWLVLQLRKSWNEILSYDWNPQWGWLIASGVFYLCGLFPAALFWRASLRWLGQKPGFFNSIMAYYSSQLGKYVPGKAMVVVIRTGMIVSKQVKVSIAAVSVFYETLTMMGSGAFIGAITVFLNFRENATFSLMALGVALCSVIPLLPPIFVRVLKQLKVGKNDPEVQEAIKTLKFSYLVVGFALMSVLWGFLALSLWAAIQGIGVAPGPLLENAPRYVASVSLAMSLGFVVVISPGGLGVREAILSTLLIPYFTHILADPANAAFTLSPESLSTIVSLIQRIVSIVAEISVFAILAAIGAVVKLKKANKEQ